LLCVAAALVIAVAGVVIAVAVSSSGGKPPVSAECAKALRTVIQTDRHDGQSVNDIDQPTAGEVCTTVRKGHESVCGTLNRALYGNMSEARAVSTAVVAFRAVWLLTKGYLPTKKKPVTVYCIPPRGG
jgi:hypothetical protein